MLNPDSKGSCWILKDFYCSVTMLRELGLMNMDEKDMCTLTTVLTNNEQLLLASTCTLFLTMTSILLVYGTLYD